MKELVQSKKSKSPKKSAKIVIKKARPVINLETDQLTTQTKNLNKSLKSD